MDKETLDWYMLNSTDLATALLGSGARVETGALAPKALRWIGEWDWIVRPLRENKPIAGAITAFTDAGKKSRRAAIVWKEKGVWKQQILEANPADSLQTLELLAVLWAVTSLEGPLNVVTDSLYVTGVVQRIEDASIKETSNKRLYELFLQLKRALRGRKSPYAVLHIRSHKWDVGLGEGNARADRLVMATGESLPISKLVLARETHSLYHQNAKGLVRQFGIRIGEAKAIVRACPVCSHHNGGSGLGCGVNPRGLEINEIWQMDSHTCPVLEG